MFKYLGIILLSTLLVGCATHKASFDVKTQAVAYKDLSSVKAPEGDPVIIAVYDFLDMTGQKKPGGNFASMSSAVTQGSYQLLIKALQDAGEGKWFRVVERSSLASLLQERKLIRTTRQLASGENAEPLPALLFAGAYITGGIVGYDSDIKSGGIGARILGIQANKQYREDIVTIILRLVNVQTGEVVITTTVEKTIVSTSTGSDVFKYFDADTMLVEIEAGYAKNEPVTFAVRKAIEKGVVDLIYLGAQKELWKFRVEVPQIKDYIEIGNDVHNDMKIEETLEQKINENKKETKVLTETEKELVKEADNKDWENVDKENTDENNDNDTGDSSGNND
jgi:curli biogenesis system outer membrane secretion channel CsgG